ncbi:hypothetical protein F4780DRAFT_763978 [Xylariomycetidae sp. FL0641]|nr:hypothetical protein F4780DRAFT_763978 [Xylariomycetidae sp. FL0641]
MSEDERPQSQAKDDRNRDPAESTTPITPATALRKPQEKEDASATEAMATHQYRTPPHDSSYVETTALEPDDAHPDSLTEEANVRAHLQDVESSFVPPDSPGRVAAGPGPEGGVDDTYLFDSIGSRRNHNTTNSEDTKGDEEREGKSPTPMPAAAPEPSDSHVLSQSQQSRHTPSLSPSPRPTSTTAAHTHPDASQDDSHAHAHLHTGTPSASSPALTPQPTPRRSGAQAAAQTSQAAPEDEGQSLPQLAPELEPEEPQPTRARAYARNNTSTLENLSSSPTAAVARRAVSRAISMASRSENQHDSSLSNESNEPNDGTPSLEIPSQYASSAQDATDRSKLSVDTGSVPGNSLNLGIRPKFLRSRYGSHRSSSSSFATTEDEYTDVTVGMDADFALQTGGAAPAAGMSNTMSRSISVGSMVSGFDETPDVTRTGPLEPLEPLEEVDSPVSNRRAGVLETPKAKTTSLNAPTDTAIARHVRNVEVPESLAREYKTKGGFATPVQRHQKPPEHTPAPSTTAKSGKTLTLKEQSSTIERLSKENFDLKLKVMFLSDRLDKLSEEGIKEMISENVELKTSLAVIQRDNKILRKRVKELEKRLRDEEDRPSTARSGWSSDGPATPAFDGNARELEEEIIYLREQIEEYITEIERLREENMSDKVEKRKLAETVKTMGDRAGERVGEGLGRQEEADVWKDLFEQETARREQADEDNRRLRDEIFRLKQDVTVSTSNGGGMHHSTSIYNMSRKARQQMSPSRPMSGLSGEMDPTQSMSQSDTLVEDLRRESEQLRHENAELRREVGAQTSMLTSRNREKERLYQEIEELKFQRRGGAAPSSLDGLLDRSASRAGVNERPISRGSALTGRQSVTVEEPEREELENKIAEQRDKINELKFKNQELQRELEGSMGEIEEAAEARRQAEEQLTILQEDLETATNDLMVLQAERDEALQEHSTLEEEFESLRREAQEEIDALEAEGDQKSDEIQRLQLDLQDRSENLDALQEEMRNMSESIVRLEDEQEDKLRRIEQLEQELAESNGELEELEAKLLESNEKAQRLGIQQESSQGEIAFLREEQESDKIRIGDLEAVLANVEQSLREEHERAKELEQRLASERKQRELVADREKEEGQQIVNELNRDVSAAKDEVRKLRKSLSSREVEATKYKERLTELENNLREALGDLKGTRSSLITSIAKLQRDLEDSLRELDSTKSALVEKDRLIKQRDELLESHGLESRRLAEMLDKERQAHRMTKNQFETFQRTHHHVSRTVNNQDSRITELESGRTADKRKIAQLESQFKEQLVERNNLLLVLWTRLSALCGTDWAHGNSLINGRALPSLESISTMLPGFSKNLLAAVKMIESLVGNFQARVKSIERDLWKEYQSLEQHLEARTKKLDRLETIVRAGTASGGFDAQSKLAALEAAYRTLKIQNATLQRAQDARIRGADYFDRPTPKQTESSGSREDLMDGGSPSPSVPTGPSRSKESSSSRIPRSKTTHLEMPYTQAAKSQNSPRTPSMTRSSSNMGTTTTNNTMDTDRAQGASSADMTGSNGDDKRWMFRLRELENKLKQEREARNMDRAAARQRIQDTERQANELTAELVRVKRRGGD